MRHSILPSADSNTVVIRDGDAEQRIEDVPHSAEVHRIRNVRVIGYVRHRATLTVQSTDAERPLEPYGAHAVPRIPAPTLATLEFDEPTDLIIISE